MADELATAKDAQYVLVNLTPDVCLTPMGSSVVPIPYPLTHRMDQSDQCSPDVFLNGEPAFLHGMSYVDNAQGDAPGSRGGVVTGVTGKVSHSQKHSESVFINGKPMVRTGDTVHMNTRKP